MKLVFQKNAEGIQLGYVECLSTEEADTFLAWFRSKADNAVPLANDIVEQAPTVIAEPEPEPEGPTQVVARNEVGRAAIALVQTKGRPALEPILKKYKAKRIAEIPETELFAAYTEINQAQEAK
jgi:hypothetical protein